MNNKVEKVCPCKKQNCSRHQNCKACRSYHNALNELPFCERNTNTNKNQ